MKPLAIVWCLTVVGGICGCAFAGQAMEQIVESVSYFEVSSPAEFERQVWSWGIPITLMFSAGRMWGPARPSIRDFLNLPVTSIIALLIGCMSGILLAALSKSGAFSDEQLVGGLPAARSHFLWGLRWGVLAGAVAVTTTVCLRIVWMSHPDSTTTENCDE